MIDNLKVINFLQDFGCAKITQLQNLFKTPNENFKSVLNTGVISKKKDILVHNNSVIDEKMLAAIDVLCQYNKFNRLKKYYINYSPIYISFIATNNLIYHIIVTDKNDEKGIVKQINNSSSIPDADKYIILFKDISMLDNIKCNKPFMYVIYPDIEINYYSK